MDFVKIKSRPVKKDEIVVYPDFQVYGFTDLMVAGGKFYAVWDEENNIWSTNEDRIASIVDAEVDAYASKMTKIEGTKTTIQHMNSFDSGSWKKYKNYISTLPNAFHPLDSKLTFLNSTIKKEDYTSKSLPYALLPGDYSAYDQLMSVLYSEEERQKLEWAIGAIVSGDSTKIQKFLVLYGDAGSGKSTVLNIIQMLFEGYYGIFDAKSLTSNSDAFATEAFASNPLVGIQHDGDLSRIEDNSTLNSIVSHEEILIKEKYKSAYPLKMNAFLFMATNKPVRISDAKSGLIRRLIDVHPTGDKIPPKEYNALMRKIKKELGAIAQHCLEVYQDLGINAYNTYKPTEMMFKTDIFYNFVDEHYFEFDQDDGVTLKAAYAMFKDYCSQYAPDRKLEMYKFKEELKNYFEHFYDRYRLDGKNIRSYYIGFKRDKFPYEAEAQAEQQPENGPIAEPMSEQERHDITEDLGIPLELKCTESLLDDILADCPAQYAKTDKFGNEIPSKTWKLCKTVLKDIDTKKVHYVKPPLNHIVIDFDIPDPETGEKSALRNLIEAGTWPATYAEFSKGGKGVHLHYIYDGDPLELANMVKEHVEIKVYSGLSSLRRRLSFCNDIPIAHLADGSLPKKGAKVINQSQVKDEKHLENLIEKHLRKEIVPSTRQSIDLIFDVLEQAYDSGIEYDLLRLKPKVMNFAMMSTNQSKYCVKRVLEMKFQSGSYICGPSQDDEAPIVFYDIEIFPGDKDNEPLLLVNWKKMGYENTVVRMINPPREEVEKLFSFRLIGFNCRRYDNHILYAYVYEGYTIQELYRLSTNIVGGGKAKGNKSYFFGPAYNLSYTDVYDFCSKKQSLKKWEIEIATAIKYGLKLIAKGLEIADAAKEVDISKDLLELHLYHPELRNKIKHKELKYRWDQPVPKDKWVEVAEYCDNDVLATEQTFMARQADWKTRLILSALSGLTPNDTTNSQSTRFIFGDEKEPQGSFNYRNLGKADVEDETEIFHYDFDTWERIPGDDGSFSIFYEKDGIIFPIFPDYKYENGESTYRGEIVGEGGYVYSEPGAYADVGLDDIASMHPSTMHAERLLGIFQDRFDDLLNARVAIKHKDFDKAKSMLDGKLAPFLDDPSSAKELSQALKIVINSVYGLTSASFKNPFKDPRNIDNIVAKRGALFMINLKHEVQKRGFTVAHIKTDSIKIPNATPEILEFVSKYGKLYGYNFEHEATYDRMCLVNDAVYIAKYASAEWCEARYGYIPEKNRDHPLEWTATGTEFQVPYVFKTLFSKEPIEFEDMCETKSVTTALYLDMNEGLPDVTAEEEELKKLEKKNGEGLDIRKQELKDIIATGHNYQFVGRVGLFAPVKPGCGGGELVREKDGKFTSANGAKDYRWLEADYISELEMYGSIDSSYYDELVIQAKNDISAYYPYEKFVSEDRLEVESKNPPPWDTNYNDYTDIPCGTNLYQDCFSCPKCRFHEDVSEWLCDDHYDIGPKE